MNRKALISDFTWRSKEMQLDASPCGTFFTPDDIPTVLRPTRRKEGFDIWVMSFGVIATKEKDVKELALMCKKRGVSVSSHEEAFSWLPDNPTSLLVGMWKTARANGSAKIGARISADKKKASTKEAVSRIKDRWPLPSKEWPTSQLLKEAGVSLNTAKAHLGKRPIAQYNYQAALKRKERRNAKAN